MTPTPKRYQFDMPMAPVEPRPLPVRRPDTEQGYPLVGTPASDQQVWQATQPVQQVVHIHQAPPDRVLQRLALGAGIGAGATAGAVYFGPLLVASMEMIAITFLIGGLVIAVLAWSVVSVVGSLKPDKTTRHGRRR